MEISLLNNFSQLIEKQVSNEIGKFTRNFPRVIFHYTNAEGALGILSSHHIWATNLDYLNDFSEFNYSRDVIIENIKKIKAKQDAPDVVAFLKKLLERIESFNNSHTNFFIACFCENGNLLIQWRAYGSNGGGYSIGVYTNLIGLHSLEKNENTFDVRPVIYDKKIQNRLIAKLLRSAIKYGNNIQEESKRNNFYNKLSNELALHLIDYLLIFKDHSFFEEQEWRAIAIADTDLIKFRSKHNEIVPYIELDLSLVDDNKKRVLPITDVIIGPTGNKKRAKSSIEWLCQKFQHYDCDISLSNIPLVKN